MSVPPDLLLVVSEPLITKCLQEMLKLGTLPPTSKLQLLCQMVSSKISAYLTTEENMWYSSFTLLTFTFVCPTEITAFSDRV